MKLYSESLTLDDLYVTADSMGMELYEADDDGTRTRGKFAGKRCMKFTLRPQKNEAGEKVRLFRTDYDGKVRRVWAVSWAGHYRFMEQVFTLDPDAVIISAISRYEGQRGFYENADATGERNIGSMMQPLMYADADHHLLGG